MACHGVYQKNKTLKETTMGQALLMGRVTFDGMNRRILPGRETFDFNKRQVL